MNQRSATFAIDTGAATVSKRRAFVRHFIEMIAAMFVGMGVFGGLATAIFAAAGSSLTDQSVELRVLLMAVYMTIPMVGWMRYRRHDWARTTEMAASMVVPSVVAAAIAWTGGLEAGAALGFQHATMIPAMLGVMLWRYDDYAHPHS